MAKKIILTLIIAMLMVGMIWVYLPEASAEPKEHFTLRYPKEQWFTLTHIADAKGFFAEEGIKIEWTGVSYGGPESILTVATSTNDAGSAAWSAIISSVAAGTKIKAVGTLIGIDKEQKKPYGQLIVLEKSNIRTVRDLVGKKIAVNTLGAHADYTLRQYLLKHGLNIKDVQLVAIPGPQHEQVLKQGQVEAAFIWDPFLGKILAGGGVRVVFSDHEVLGTTTVGGTYFRQDFIKKNPEVVKRFLRAFAKAADWVNNPKNQREAKEITAKAQGNPDLAKYSSGYIEAKGGLVTARMVQQWIDFKVTDGSLKPGQVKAADIYDSTLHPRYQGE